MLVVMSKVIGKLGLVKDSRVPRVKLQLLSMSAAEHGSFPKVSTLYENLY